MDRAKDAQNKKKGGKKDDKKKKDDSSSSSSSDDTSEEEYIDDSPEGRHARMVKAVKHAKLDAGIVAASTECNKHRQGESSKQV